MSFLTFPSGSPPNAPTPPSLLTEDQMALSLEFVESLISQLDSQFSSPPIDEHSTNELNTKILPLLNRQRIFSHAIVFEHPNSYLYQIRLLLEYDPAKPSIHSYASKGNLRTFARNDLTTRLEIAASNYAVWLEQSDSSDSFDNPSRIILFDSWPNYPDVLRYPHHFHTYEENIRSSDGFEFLGNLDSIIDQMVPALDRKIA